MRRIHEPWVIFTNPSPIWLSMLPCLHVYVVFNSCLVLIFFATPFPSVPPTFLSTLHTLPSHPLCKRTKLTSTCRAGVRCSGLFMKTFTLAVQNYGPYIHLHFPPLNNQFNNYGLYLLKKTMLFYFKTMGPNTFTSLP